MPKSATWLRNPIRRAADAGAAIAGLIILSPVLASVAIIVARAVGRPILFNQQRAGLHGHPIIVPKFRTMTNERGEDGSLLSDELRLTPTGRRLRSLSLDELPQLWSVLKGDMSLVGPRPLPITYVDRYSPSQVRRLDARPGITGWAQISGRNSLEWPEKLSLDVWYVEHASPRLDLEILVRTIGAVIHRNGVSAEGHTTMPEFMGDT